MTIRTRKAAAGSVALFVCAFLGDALAVPTVAWPAVPTRATSLDSANSAADPGEAIQSPAPAPDLVLAYAFDEGAGATTADGSGKSGAATLLNVEWGPGRYGAGLSFSGVESSVTAQPAGLPSSTAPQTIACWVSAAARTAEPQPVVALAGEAQESTFQLGFRSSQFGAWQSPGSWLVLGIPPPARSWHHVAYTYDGRTHRLYVDGNAVSSSTIAPKPAAPTRLQLGRSIAGTDYFTGMLDEVRIYGRALNQPEIQALMATGSQ